MSPQMPQLSAINLLVEPHIADVLALFETRSLEPPARHMSILPGSLL